MTTRVQADSDVQGHYSREAGATVSIVGLDLGGTKIAAGVVENGKILSKVVLPTPPAGGEAVIRHLAQAAQQAAQAADAQVTAVGLGVPGPLDYASSTVRFAGNIRGWVDYPVRRLLAEALGCPVFLENDANAAALAEHRFGAGQATDSSLYVTVSTGVGSGFVQGDRVLRGHHGQGVEVGHLTVLAGGPVCCCGLDGCLEALVSGAALERMARASFGHGMTTPELFQQAKRGNERAERIVMKSAEWLGIGLASLARCYDPQVIVLGGGIYLNAGSGYQEAVLQSYKKYMQGWEAPGIRPAKLGGDAGLLGAAYTALLGF